MSGEHLHPDAAEARKPEPTASPGARPAALQRYDTPAPELTHDIVAHLALSAKSGTSPALGAVALPAAGAGSDSHRVHAPAAGAHGRGSAPQLSTSTAASLTAADIDVSAPSAAASVAEAVALSQELALLPPAAAAAAVAAASPGGRGALPQLLQPSELVPPPAATDSALPADAAVTDPVKLAALHLPCMTPVPEAGPAEEEEGPAAAGGAGVGSGTGHGTNVNAGVNIENADDIAQAAAHPAWTAADRESGAGGDCGLTRDTGLGEGTPLQQLPCPSGPAVPQEGGFALRTDLHRTAGDNAPAAHDPMGPVGSGAAPRTSSTSISRGSETMDRSPSAPAIRANIAGGGAAGAGNDVEHPLPRCERLLDKSGSGAIASGGDDDMVSPVAGTAGSGSSGADRGSDALARLMDAPYPSTASSVLQRQRQTAAAAVPAAAAATAGPRAASASTLAAAQRSLFEEAPIAPLAGPVSRRQGDPLVPGHAGEDALGVDTAPAAAAPPQALPPPRQPAYDVRQDRDLILAESAVAHHGDPLLAVAAGRARTPSGDASRNVGARLPPAPLVRGGQPQGSVAPAAGTAGGSAVCVGGAGRGSAPAAGLHAHQLVGGSTYPRSAFPAHGDPLFTAAAAYGPRRGAGVRPSVTAPSEPAGTDTGLAGLPRREYACAPSRDATHGDARVGVLLPRERLAPSFAPSATVAQPHVGDEVATPTPRDGDAPRGGAATAYGAAAATDAARGGNGGSGSGGGPTHYDPRDLGRGRGVGLTDAELPPEQQRRLLGGGEGGDDSWSGGSDGGGERQQPHAPFLMAPGLQLGSARTAAGGGGGGGSGTGAAGADYDDFAAASASPFVVGGGRPEDRAGLRELFGLSQQPPPASAPVPAAGPATAASQGQQHRHGTDSGGEPPAAGWEETSYEFF